MLHIERLRLHLPPGYQHRADFIARQVGESLAGYRPVENRKLDSLTIDEFLQPPYLIAVEWPEHVPDFFADYTTYRISLEILPDHRHRITLL